MFGYSPNITGWFGANTGIGVSGVFSTGETEDNHTITSAGNNNKMFINFDASRDSSYFSADKVQVSALQVLACIKI